MVTITITETSTTYDKISTITETPITTFVVKIMTSTEISTIGFVNSLSPSGCCVENIIKLCGWLNSGNINFNFNISSAYHPSNSGILDL